MGLPYTYLIKHLPSNRVYYGCRFSKDCHPDDLWKTYFTSSKHVKKLIEKDGKDSFIFEIRKTFESIGECRNWENRVLLKMNVIKRDIFINKTNNKSIAIECSRYSSQRRSPKAKLKQIEIARRMGLSNKGSEKSDEFKNLMRYYHSIGKLKSPWIKSYKDSEKTRKKKSLSKIGKPSNALGSIHPRCSCIICRKSCTAGTIKQHYDFHHLGIKRKRSVEHHSEETKYKFRVRRNKYVNNGTTELLIEDYNERIEFLNMNNTYQPGKVLRKRGT